MAHDLTRRCVIAEIGSAFLSIIPSARNFGRTLENDVSRETNGVGKKVGSGFGKAFGAAAGLVAAAGIGSFLKDSIGEAREAQKVGAATTAIIKATGGAANLTADQVGNLSAALSNKIGVDDEAIQAGANLLLTFKNVRNEIGKGNDVFARATAAGADLAAAGFGSIEGNAKQLGKALNDPLKGISALGRAGVTFTEGQKKQIKGFVAANDLLSAQKIILGEVEKQVGGTAEATATSGEKAAVAYGNLKEQIGTALLPVVDQLAEVFADKIAPAISGFVAGIQDGTGAGGTFATIIGGLYNNILQPLGSFLFGTVVPAIGQFVGQMTAGVGAGGAFRDFLVGIYNAIKPIGDFIMGTVVPAIAAFVAGMASGTGSGGQFVTFLASLRDFVTGQLIPALASMYAYFQANVLPVFVQVAGIIRDQVIPTLVALAQFFVTKILPVIVNTATAVGSKLKPVFEQLVETFKAKVLPAIQQILAKFEEYRPTIQKVIEVVAKIIGKSLEFAASILGKVLPPLIRFAGFLISNAVPAVLDVIDVIADIIKKAIEFGTVIVDRVKDVAKFVTGLKDKFGEALTFIKGIPGKILSGLGSLALTLFSAGADLIRGFISGIKNVAGQIIGAIKEAITDKLPSFVKKALGIKSPSRVFAELGRYTMDGFTLGIRQGAGKTVSAMSSAIRDTLEAAIGGLDEKAAKLKAKIAGLRSDIAEGVGGKKARKELKDKLGDLLKDLADTQVEILDRMRDAADKVLDKIRDKRDAIKGVLGDLKSDFKSLRDGIASAFTGNLFEATNVGDFVRNLAQTSANLGNLKAAFKKLLGFGLDPAFLAQLFQSGNLPLILDLAKEPRDQALNAQSLFNQTNSLANSLGTAVAREEVGPKIDRTNQRLESIERVLRNQAAEFAEAINNASTRGARGRAA